MVVCGGVIEGGEACVVSQQEPPHTSHAVMLNESSVKRQRKPR